MTAMPSQPVGHPDRRQAAAFCPMRGLGAILLGLLLTLGFLPVDAQPASPADAATERDAGIAPADIPSRADADEKFIQSAQRRAQAHDRVLRIEQALSRQAAAIDRLTEVTEGSDLSALSVQRLESLERHWLLQERTLAQTRAELMRATNTASEDAAELDTRRAAWQATSAQADLSSALRQRSEEMVALTERARSLLAEPLSRLIDLGRRSSALSAQVQAGVAEVARQVAEEDRRLATMDSPPFWQAVRDVDQREPVAAGLWRSLAIETAFARDHDAARARLLPALGAAAAVLLPLMFWLRRRARALRPPRQRPAEAADLVAGLAQRVREGDRIGVAPAQWPADLPAADHHRLGALDQQPVRIEAEREVAGGEVAHELAQPGCILDRGQSVEVGQEVVALVLILQTDELADRAEVVADVQVARGLDAGQNAHGVSLSGADDSKKKPAASAPAGHCCGMGRDQPSLPMASVGQDSMASSIWAVSSSFSGCLLT